MRTVLLDTTCDDFRKLYRVVHHYLRKLDPGCGFVIHWEKGFGPERVRLEVQMYMSVDDLPDEDNEFGRFLNREPRLATRQFFRGANYVGARPHRSIDYVEIYTLRDPTWTIRQIRMAGLCVLASRANDLDEASEHLCVLEEELGLEEADTITQYMTTIKKKVNE